MTARFLRRGKSAWAAWLSLPDDVLKKVYYKAALRVFKGLPQTGLVGNVGITVSAAKPSGEIIEQVLVKVNGEIITKTDLEARQISALRKHLIRRERAGTATRADRWMRMVAVNRLLVRLRSLSR